MEPHGLDNEKQIFFYENEYYVFSNFSSFAIEWKGKLYPTSEHVYQSEKFEDEELKEKIRVSKSAHDAFKLANELRNKYKSNWEIIKLDVMKEILKAKVVQHPYVLKKVLESGDRELIENSWRDSFWGCGENQDGKNHLGKLWVKIRDDLFLGLNPLMVMEKRIQGNQK